MVLKLQLCDLCQSVCKTCGYFSAIKYLAILNFRVVSSGFIQRWLREGRRLNSILMTWRRRIFPSDNETLANSLQEVGHVLISNKILNADVIFR